MDSYYINVSHVNYEDNIDFLFNFVDRKKKEKALRFVHKEDRMRTVIGDILVRTYICKNYGINNKDIKFKYNEFNKPLIDNAPNINFNISHSGDYVAVAFDNEEIGIDVEQIKDIEYEDIMKNFFAESENLWINHIKDCDKKREFFKLWTLKESFVKFRGKGLSIPFDSFALDMQSENDIYTLKDKKEKVFFKNFAINENYELSLCSYKKDMKIKELSYKDLLGDINTYLY